MRTGARSGVNRIASSALLRRRGRGLNAVVNCLEPGPETALFEPGLRFARKIPGLLKAHSRVKCSSVVLASTILNDFFVSTSHIDNFSRLYQVLMISVA